ncbi:putative membrane protein [Mobilisporobacter senegalensis]|uniref:Putative membrane protein n=1 Tax=Mobilisporobacter senegalensis TaxID=1329262 RepID=A0A3N1XPG6_9FIRM|nr:ECF transporter S component [Mobilisporobacter senegalensis]ROR28590.1 putative membrane protein [Mobilisporobacter senegalensis]
MITNNKTRKIVMAALMAAMCCIATMIIQVPSPTGGYIHLGDGLVLLSGIILGPVYGLLAAGIGSMLADLLSGYPQYAIATLLIKGIAAIVGGTIYSILASKLTNRTLAVMAAGVGGGIVVTLGYFSFDALFISNNILAAATGIPANIVQNIFGIIVSSLLMPFLVKSPYIKSLLSSEA